MLSRAPKDAVLQDRLEDEAVRRRFSTRLDMTLKRKKLSAASIARHVGVAVEHLNFWRAGITVPSIAQCRKLSALLDVPLEWLCAFTPVGAVAP